MLQSNRNLFIYEGGIDKLQIYVIIKNICCTMHVAYNEGDQYATKIQIYQATNHYGCPMYY